MSKNFFSKALFLFALVTLATVIGSGFSHEALAKAEAGDGGLSHAPAGWVDPVFDPVTGEELSSPYQGSLKGSSGNSSSYGYGGYGGGGGSGTFGDLLCYAFDNALSFGFIFQLIAYCSGVLAALKGIHHLKMHVDAPQNNKIGIGLAYLGGSMGLLALPSAVSVLTETAGIVYDTGGGGSALMCGAPADSGVTGGGLDQIMINFVTDFKHPMMSVASVIAILAGLFMIINGLMKASKYGTDPRTYSIHSILTNLGFGAILMTLGDMMNMVSYSIFGHAKDSADADNLSWTTFNSLFGGNAAGLDRFELAVTAALTFVQIIGVIAFVRGWLILKKVVEGGGNSSLTQGLTHVLGGVLAINIFEFIEVMDRTFGTNLFTGN